MLELVRPSLGRLPQYKAALETGWSPDNIRLEAFAKEQLAKIAADAAKFIDNLTDIEAKGDSIKMPDGSLSQRLPGYHLWIWDGEFCGNVGFRWQPGTPELPPHCLGHIGYSIVPWKRRRGYATEALRLLLPEAKKIGLPFVYISANPNNLPSQKVILANQGVLLGKFQKTKAYGEGQESLRYRITLT